MAWTANFALAPRTTAGPLGGGPRPRYSTRGKLSRFHSACHKL